MASLQEALQQSGIVAEVAKARQKEIVERETARKERSANLQPHQRWWQNFRFTATPFEVKMFVKVQAEQWHEALDFIAARNLNKVTTRCRTKSEAIRQVRAKILDWQKENVLMADVEPPAEALLYWRIYDKEED